MATATLIKKKERNFQSLLNQFSGGNVNAITTAKVLPASPINRKGAESAIVQIPAQSLTAKLNALIAVGVSFDVGIDDFQVIGAGDLTGAENQFLLANKRAVLCTLQQALLVKHLFSGKPELKPVFVLKIRDLAQNDCCGHNPPFEAACEISAKWFARLLETMPDRNEI